MDAERIRGQYHNQPAAVSPKGRKTRETAVLIRGRQTLAGLVEDDELCSWEGGELTENRID